MEDLCSACLCPGRKLTCISGTSVYYFYKQIVNEISVSEEMPQLAMICWECRALLHRFQSFQQQVKCCYLELLMCLQQNSSSKLTLAKPPHLQTQLLTSISYPEVKSESLDIKVEADEVHCEPETFVNQLTWKPGHPDGRADPEVIESEAGSVQHRAGRRRGPRRGEGKTKKREKRKVKREIVYESDLDTAEPNDDRHDEDSDRVEADVAKVCDSVERLGRVETAETGADRIETSADRSETGAGRNETGAGRSETGAGRSETVASRSETVAGRSETSAAKNETSAVKSDNRVSCEQCVSSFSTRSELALHVELEHDGGDEGEGGGEGAGRGGGGRGRGTLPERPQCVECGKVFSSRKTYRYHLNVLHKGQNRHPCPRCGKVYQWKSNLGRHMRTHKARESGELYCVKCDKSFASVATYRQHIRISRRHVSESEFTFACGDCGKRFVNKTRLRDHVDWEHLHRIKFRCQLCDKPFKCHTSLYVHLQNVHRDKEKKDNLCHVCGKSYQNAAKLKYHIVAMHTSETPYRCPECGAAFGWYSSLYRHLREVHYKMKIQTKKSKKEKKLQLQDLVPLTAGLPGP